MSLRVIGMDTLGALAHTLTERHRALEAELARVEASVVPNGGKASRESNTQRLHALRARIEHVVERVDARLDAAGGTVHALHDALDGGADDLDEARHALRSSTENADDSLERAWGQCRAEVERLSHTLEEIQASLASHDERLTEDVEAFGDDTGALVAHLAQDVATIEQRLEHILQGFLRQLHGLRERAQQHIRRTFVDDALSTLEGAASTLLDGLGELRSGAERHGRQIGDATGGFQSDVQQIAHLVESIRPVLDTIRAIT